MCCRGWSITTVMLAPRNIVMRRFETSTSPIVLAARGSELRSPRKVFHSPNYIPILLWSSSYRQEKQLWPLCKSRPLFRQVWHPLWQNAWIFLVKLLWVVLHHQMMTQMIRITSHQLGHAIQSLQKTQIVK